VAVPGARTAATCVRRWWRCRHRPRWWRETFSPSSTLRYRRFDEAIALHNGVPQGLASSIFTTDLREAEQFLAAAGQRLRHRQREHRAIRRRDRRRLWRREGDRRRSRGGLDAWRNYMRRATNTINYSGSLPLAQGALWLRDDQLTLSRAGILAIGLDDPQRQECNHQETGGDRHENDPLRQPRGPRQCQDHRVRFVIGSVVVAIGAALWLAEMARSLVG
jgi:hypothetical protein